MRSQNIIVGTLILSISSIFVRMIGFVFRVWLSGAMGTEGIGVYSLIMSLYSVCATLATSGISGGVAKLAAGEFAKGNSGNARRILGRSLTLSLLLSCTVGILLFCFAGPVGQFILRDGRTVLSLKFLAPGLPMMAVSGCLRGYFIAQRKVGNPAVSQVLEQLLKMAFIMTLIGYWMPKGIEYGCAVVILGITVGELVCLFISLAGFAVERRRRSRAPRANITGVTKSLLAFAIPISIGSYIRSILRLLEDVLVISGLRAFSGEQGTATGTYGLLKGMVMPLLLFPLQLLSALVVTLTPEISRMSGLNDPKKLERAISRILQFTSVVGIFIVCVFMSFSYELGMVVYKSPEAGQMLKLLSWLCPFMCLEMVVVSILQGLGEQVSSLRYNVADCLLRIVMVYFLIPKWGVNGFLLMVAVSNLFTSVLNLRRLVRITHIPLRFGEWVAKPVLAALATCQMVRVLCNFYLFQALPIWLSLVIGVGVTGIAYIVILFSIGALAPEDFGWITHRIFSAKKTIPADPERAF